MGDPPEKVAFERAHRRAVWNALIAFLYGRSNRLLSWQEVYDALGVGEQTYLGVYSVPIAQIVGSVGREQDFDRAFMPKNPGVALRWQAIARAYDRGVRLPPVKLLRVGDVYFCLDGHHRISVAREKGMQSIQAKVFAAEARVAITGDMGARGVSLQAEYARFLERTNLDRRRPGLRIEFTVQGGYERLLWDIAAHRERLERGRQPVTVEQAASDWYDRRYLPMVQIIRAQEILSDFPHRTEADLYVWIVEHLHALQEMCGPGVLVERAAEHFANHHSARLVKRVVYAVREWMDGQACELLTGVSETGQRDGAAEQSSEPS